MCDVCLYLLYLYFNKFSLQLLIHLFSYELLIFVTNTVARIWFIWFICLLVSDQSAVKLDDSVKFPTQILQNKIHI